MFAANTLRAARRRSVALRLSVVAATAGALLVAANAPARGAATSPAGARDADAAPDVSSALAIATAYRHRVEVLSSDDETSTTYVNPDGTATTDLSSTPVRFRQGTGWTPVDMNLRTLSDGSIAPVAAPLSLTLGGAGATTIAALHSGAGTVSYGWPTPLPAPVLSGSSATYRNVRPGVDLLVTTTTSGFEVSVVFGSAQAAAAGPVDLTLSTQALTATATTTGAVSFTDASGAVVASSPAPLSWDSRLGGDRTGPGAGPVARVAQTMKTSTGATVRAGTAIAGAVTDELRVPSALLNDPSTVYPLVVDPSVGCTTCTETGWHGYVENDGDSEMNTSFDNGWIHVGTFDGGTTKTRGLIAFRQGATHGQHIASASLKIENTHSWSCTKEPITIYKSNAFDNSATWTSATLPATNDATATPAFAAGYSSSCPAAWENFSTTNIITDEANDSSGYYYLQLRTSETSSSYWKKFDSTATLSVSYNSIPSTPTGQKIAPCFVQCAEPAITSDTTPTLYASADTADGENLDFKFEVGSGWAGAAGSVQTKSDVSTTATSLTWPTALFTGQATKNYEYRVTACDHGTTVCKTSGWFEFTVDTLPPAAPTASSTAFDLSGATTKGTQDPGQVTLAAGDSRTYEVAYSLDSGTPVFSAPCNGTSMPSGDTFTTCSLPATVTLVPNDMTNTLSAWAWTKAGVVSAKKTWTFKVDVRLAGSPDHAWVETDAADGAATVPDWSGATTPLPLTLAANSTWLGAESGPHQDALSLAGALGTDQAAGAITSGAPLKVDGSTSFTVAVWVRPNVVNDGAYHAIVSTNSAAGKPNPLFWLQEHAGTWRLCMPTDQTTYSDADCVASSTTDDGAPAVGVWSFVIAQWDAAQRQMRLYVYGRTSSAVYAASHTQVPANVAVPLTFGWTAGNRELFNGAIADPLAYNTVLIQSQRDTLWSALPPTLNGAQ